MAWALVNRATMTIMVGAWSEGVYSENPVEAVPGTIVNLIAYNGTDQYTPAENLDLVEVPDSAKVGDTGY